MEFDIVPPSSTVTWVLGGIAVLLIALTGFFVWLALFASSLSVVIDNAALEIKVPMYSRTIPVSQLDLERLEVARIAKGSPLRPRIRTNGIGLPGYGVGWFRLKNGDKALLAVTSRDPVVYIPTTEGYSVMLSVREPQQFVERLRAAAGNG